MGGSPKNLIIAIIFAMLTGAFFVALLLSALSIRAFGHDWYPSCFAGQSLPQAAGFVWFSPRSPASLDWG